MVENNLVLTLGELCDITKMGVYQICTIQEKVGVQILVPQQNCL